MSSRAAWLTASFVLTLLVTGVVYWTPAYNVVQLPEGLFGLGALVAFGLAAASAALSPASIASITGSITAAMIGVVAVRIGMDTAVDPTTHNLLPFEIVIALVVGAGIGCAGALAGRAAGAIVRRVTAP